jgi:hypothetical protein
LLAAIAGEDQAAHVAELLVTGIPDGLVQHQIAGNWVRGLRISPSEAWRSGLPPWIERLTALFSWPWRRSYRFETFRLLPPAGEEGDP